MQIGASCAGGSNPCATYACDSAGQCAQQGTKANDTVVGSGEICCSGAETSDETVANCGSCSAACSAPDGCTPATCSGGTCGTTSACTGGSSCSGTTCVLPCVTTITYGNAWIHPSGHPGNTDTPAGEVTWDGTCTTSGSNSYAVLSNGWMPYFTGTSACIMALDESASCANSGTPCTTQVTYGSAWIPPPNHPNDYDDVLGQIYSEGTCLASGSNSYATLSNGWMPYFTGLNACALSFMYTQCGGLCASCAN